MDHHHKKVDIQQAFHKLKFLKPTNRQLFHILFYFILFYYLKLFQNFKIKKLKKKKKNSKNTLYLK